jgi:hypothetical protein
VIEFTYIPATDVQPGEPGYDFRVSRFEIRNDQPTSTSKTWPSF